MLGKSFLGIASDGVHESRFVTTARDTNLNVGAAFGAEDRRHDVEVRRLGGDEHQWRNSIAVPIVADLTVTGIDAVQLSQEGFHELGLVGIVSTISDPTAFTTDAATSDMENLDADLERIERHGDDVSVSTITKYDSVALQSFG